MSLKKASARITSLIRRSRLSTRLLIVFLVISLLPGLVLTFVANAVYEKSIEANTSESARQTLDLLNNNFLLILDEFNKYISDISISEDVQSFLSSRRDDVEYSGIFTSLKYAEKFIYSTSIRDTILFDVSGNVAWSKGTVGQDTDKFAALLAATDSSSPRDYVSFYEPPYGADCIVICRKIYDNHFKKVPVGYIAMFVSANVLDKQAFPVTHFGGDSSMFLLNANGIVVASQDSSPFLPENTVSDIFSAAGKEPREASYQISIPGNHDLILCVHNEKYDLYLCSVIANSALNADIRRTKGMVLCVTAVLLFVCLVLSVVVYNSVIDPVVEIISVCKRREQDSDVHLIRDTAQDEVGYLSRTIDSMILKDVRSMEELRLRDEQKRELELQILRDQLNPHFLFNTLNTFQWIAGLNGMDRLKDGISSLAGLLRNTLEEKDEMITLQAEIDSLKSYCTILSLRYAGQFTVSYYLEEKSKDCPIPRFLLQPLVENAILHGIQGTDDILNISVTSSIIQDFLCITVIDDGAGFEVGQVYDKETSLFKGIGLSNVHNRLNLYYGDSGDFSIESSVGKGTICRIRIPLAAEKEKTYVSDPIR